MRFLPQNFAPYFASHLTTICANMLCQMQAREDGEAEGAEGEIYRHLKSQCWQSASHLKLIPIASELNQDNHPDQGLEPFGAKHSKLFFGHDEVIE